MGAEAAVRIERTATIGAVLRAAGKALSSSETSELDAQVLLARVLGAERAFLFAHPEQVLADAHIGKFRSMIERRAAGEPIAYITGVKGFYDIDLLVTPAVLIPRPETELLLEEALRLSDDRPKLTAADIGTGSGALAVTFARQRPAATVYATDISADALAIARKNAERNGVKPLFFTGDLAEPLIKRGIQVDVLLANLPYIASDDLANLAVSRYEPNLALDGGTDGLDLVRRLLSQIPALCRAGADVLLEIGADQAKAVTRLVRERFGVQCDILPDYAGFDRIARFRV